MRRSPPSATMRSASGGRCAERAAGEALQRAGGPKQKKPASWALTRNKRPQGRAPAGYTAGMSMQTGDCGVARREREKPFELVDHPSRHHNALRAVRSARGCAGALHCHLERRLTVCSKKKNSDGNHGKPFSKNVKLILLSSQSQAVAKQAEDEAEARAEAAASACVSWHGGLVDFVLILWCHGCHQSS